MSMWKKEDFAEDEEFECLYLLRKGEDVLSRVTCLPAPVPLLAVSHLPSEANKVFAVTIKPEQVL